MLKIVFCQECERELREYGDFIFYAFEIVCLSYFYGVPFEVPVATVEHTDGIVSMSKFLEMKGYVITTESGLNTLQIKPLHVLSIDDGDEIHVRFCKHDC